MKTETKLQIMFELATAFKRLGKTRDYEEILQGAKNIATDRLIREKVLLELGRFLYEQGRYEEALATLREGERLGLARQKEFAGLERSASETLELQRQYQAAERAWTGGKLVEAKSLLAQIREKNSSYKDVGHRIAELDSMLIVEAGKQALATTYEQAQRFETEGKLELAIATYENLLQQAGDFKDARSKLQALRLQLEQKHLRVEMESEYEAGLAALKEHEWTRAILAFEKVQGWDQNYRDLRRRLAEAQNGLERESNEAILARYYSDGVAAMNRGDLGRAFAAFEKVHKSNSGYREVAALRAECEQALQQETQSVATPRMPETRLDSLYTEATSLLEKADWMHAVIALEKLQVLHPNYRDVTERLEQARQNLPPAAGSEVAAANSSHGQAISSYWGGALAVLMIMPLVGFVLFSSVIRARYYVSCGNFPAAAAVYEKLLARNPKRVKLYPSLANIYLLLGRHDERAMKVFETILQLNLTVRNREEISSVVAKYYLTQERADAGVITAPESALQIKRPKEAGEERGA